MSKRRPQGWPAVALPASRQVPPGFHTGLSLVHRWPVRRGARGFHTVITNRRKRRHMTWLAYPHWLNAGDNAWQMTAATFVGLMSLPGLAVLYGGVMQKRWSVNSMMLTFVAFSLVLVAWCLWAFKMGFGSPIARAAAGSSARRLLRHRSGASPGSVLSARRRGGPGADPVDHRPGPPFHFPDVLARVLPVRVRGDHADPDAGLGARVASASRRGSRSCCCGSRSSTPSTRS